MVEVGCQYVAREERHRRVRQVDCSLVGRDMVDGGVVAAGEHRIDRGIGLRS